jgi:hypothetical protein
MRIGFSKRDSGGFGGGIVASGRDSRGGTVASRRDLGGLGGRIVASRHDSDRVAGGIGGFERVEGFAHLFEETLGCNGCKALLFLDRARHAIQVEKTLVPGLAEAFARKEDIGSF